MTPGWDRLAIVGGGSWGTALGVVLAPNFAQVRTVMHDAERAATLSATRENFKHLPGIPLPANLAFTADWLEGLDGARIVLVAVPSVHVRSVVKGFRNAIDPEALIVSTTKGLEPGSLLRMSEVIASAAAIRPDRVLALSGPSFALEAARGLPTAVVVAGPNEPVRLVQAAFAKPTFRVYSSEDPIGVEMGGALKNVVAIGAGIATGLGLGHNSVAALITRGLAEITRLAVAMGARPTTLAGLAGLGDLVLTCTGALSRNRQLGIELSLAHSAREVLLRSTSTTEGVRTARAAVDLARRFGVEMPIAVEMSAVLEAGRSPEEALRRLMERSLKEE